MIGKDVQIGPRTTIGEGVVIDDGVKIGSGCFIGHNTVIRDRVVLGNNVIIGHLCVIERDTVIKEGTTIQSQSHITAQATIGKQCYFGPCVMIINERRISKWREMDQKLQGPVIGDFCRIGAASRIAPGVKIGNNCEIGMGAVVMDDVPDNQVWFSRKAKAEYQYDTPEGQRMSDVVHS